MMDSIACHKRKLFCLSFLRGDLDEKLLNVAMELCESLKIVTVEFSGQITNAKKIAKFT